MDNMLKDILRAEREAKAFTDEAERYKASVMAETEQEIARIKAEKLAQAKQDVEAIRQQHKKSVADSMQTEVEHSEAEIAAMRAVAKEKSEQWAQEIFKRTVSV